MDIFLPEMQNPPILYCYSSQGALFQLFRSYLWLASSYGTEKHSFQSKFQMSRLLGQRRCCVCGCPSEISSSSTTTTTPPPSPRFTTSFKLEGMNPRDHLKLWPGINWYLVTWWYTILSRGIRTSHISRQLHGSPPGQIWDSKKEWGK